MPDNNFQKLREISYHVPVTCNLCVHSRLQGGFWGWCLKHRYAHKKQDNTEGGRGVSVVSVGTCPDATLDDSKAARLDTHREFLDHG